MEEQNCLVFPPSEGPWIVYIDDQGTNNHTFYSLSDNKSYIRSFPELSNNEVLNSCHGWLILSKDSQYSLWNPVSLETICLPPLELKDKSEITDCILSSPPNNPDSTLFLFDRGIKSIWFCRLKNKKNGWFTHCYEEEIRAISNIEDDENWIWSPVCCDCGNNTVYAQAFQRDILVRIDIIEPHSLVLEPILMLPFTKSTSVSPCQSMYLFMSLGNLFTVVVYYDSVYNKTQQLVEIQIYKLDSSSMEWERVRSAKDRAFLVSQGGGFSGFHICSETIGNRLYYVRHGDNSLYSYDIENSNLFISLPCPNLTSSKPPIWVMPTCRLTNSYEEAFGVTRKEQAGKESEKEAIISQENGRVSPQHVDRWEAQCDLSPGLIFFQEYGHLCNFVSPPHGNRSFFEVPEPLNNASILYCKDGWLLMGEFLEDDTMKLTFFHPLTGDVIPYDDLSDLSIYAFRFAFTSPPTSSNCVVVAISSTADELDVDVHICRSRGGGWATFKRSCNKTFYLVSTNPVFVNGELYFLSMYGNLCVLRLQEEDCEWEVLEDPQKDLFTFSESFFAERNGELFLVITGEIGGWVQVFMLCRSTMSWERVEDLGNYTLYVSRTSSLFTIANSQEMANKIYFPRFSGRFCGEHLVYYCLSTKSLHSSKTEGSLSNYQGTTEPLICGWIESN